MNQIVRASEINSSAIIAELGADAELSFLAESGEGEGHISVWSFIGNHGICRVALTNGEPVWEEADPELFADLLENRIIEIVPA